MRMLEREISIIVPVYNTEKYLDDCIHSVLKQTYKSFELILVDDGSKDGSRKKCEGFCKEDKRIRYIYQEHKGVSAARNVGMEEAVGKYLFFLDSDDFIHPQLLEVLYRLQETNQTTIATVGFHCVSRESSLNIIEQQVERESVRKDCCLKCDKAMKPRYFASNTTRLTAIGGKLILREAIQTIRFDESLTKSEDTLFLFKVIANGGDVTVLFQEWYYYRITTGGKKKADSIEFCRNKIEVISYIRDYEIKNNKMADAKCTEWIICCEIVKWNRDIQWTDDMLLKAYLERLIETEKQTCMFAKMNIFKRLIFCIGCAHYPFYATLERIWKWYFRILKWICVIGRNVEYNLLDKERGDTHKGTVFFKFFFRRRGGTSLPESCGTALRDRDRE